MGIRPDNTLNDIEDKFDEFMGAKWGYMELFIEA